MSHHRFERHSTSNHQHLLLCSNRKAHFGRRRPSISLCQPICTLRPFTSEPHPDRIPGYRRHKDLYQICRLVSRSFSLGSSLQCMARYNDTTFLFAGYSLEETTPVHRIYNFMIAICQRNFLNMVTICSYDVGDHLSRSDHSIYLCCRRGIRSARKYMLSLSLLFGSRRDIQSSSICSHRKNRLRRYRQ